MHKDIDAMKLLITGGAGFIGSRLACQALDAGASVTILDSFNPQIHGNKREMPDGLGSHVRVIEGDVRDRSVMEASLIGQDVVVHLAAETGTGQSMYDVAHYSDVNLNGTSLLFDILANGGAKSVNKVVTASSRAVYGEGAYSCNEHGTVYPAARTVDAMKAGNFDPVCPICSRECTVVPTTEDAVLSPSSFYGLTKQVQEQMTMMFAETLRISGYALRFQNVYGPGQSLKNPYTGILAIFSTQARMNAPIYIFEDGQESRDFVYIDDVISAIWSCVADPQQRLGVYNVGSGIRTKVQCVVDQIVQTFNSSSTVTINGAFRVGDIRHNYADISRIRQTFGFAPKWKFEDGLTQFLTWAVSQDADGTGYEKSLREMASKGLMHG